MNSKAFFLSSLSMGLIMGAALFGDQSNQAVQTHLNCCPCEELRGEPISTCSYQPAFNAPAAIAVKNSCYDVFVDASFLYWQANQEAIELASSAAFVLSPSGTGMQASPASNGSILSFDPDFKPAFKVGLGISADQDWVISAEYTWFRSNTHVSKNPPATGFGTPVWVSNDWFESLSGQLQPISATHISANWKIAIDLVDASFDRPFYQGEILIISPFAGLRAAFIRQHLNIAFTEVPGDVAILAPQPIHSHNHSISSGVGPRMGFESALLLPMGFRIQGDLALSVLWTHYNVHHKENAADATSIPQVLKASRKVNWIRPMIETGMGLGWGRYLSDQQYHIDFSATYDFAVFWNQNAMRKLMGEFVRGISSSEGDLYLQGLTVKARFDF